MRARRGWRTGLRSLRVERRDGAGVYSSPRFVLAATPETASGPAPVVGVGVRVAASSAPLRFSGRCGFGDAAVSATLRFRRRCGFGDAAVFGAAAVSATM